MSSKKWMDFLQEFHSPSSCHSNGNSVEAENLCIFWCLLRKCQSKQANKSTESCLHGIHTRTIDSYIYNRKYIQALQLLRYFLDILNTNKSTTDKVEIKKHKKLNYLTQNIRCLMISTIYEYFAHLLCIHNDFQSSDYYFDEANNVYPNCRLRMIKHAEMLSSSNYNINKAKNIYEKLVELEPFNARYYYLYGIFLREYNQDVDKSIKYFEKALELSDSKWTDARVCYYYEYGLTWFIKGFSYYDKALAMFKQVLDTLNNNQFKNNAINSQFATPIVDKQQIEQMMQRIENITCCINDTVTIDFYKENWNENTNS